MVVLLFPWLRTPDKPLWESRSWAVKVQAPEEILVVQRNVRWVQSGDGRERSRRVGADGQAGKLDRQSILPTNACRVQGVKQYNQGTYSFRCVSTLLIPQWQTNHWPHYPLLPRWLVNPFLFAPYQWMTNLKLEIGQTSVMGGGGELQQIWTFPP